VLATAFFVGVGVLGDDANANADVKTKTPVRAMTLSMGFSCGEVCP
jgi:hypothetical protein